MQNVSRLVEHHKHGETETSRVVEPFQHFLRLLKLYLTPRLARIVVHMDIYKVIVNQMADCAVVGDEISETQAPRAPVATHLADNELVLCLGFCHGLINLCDGVDVLIVHLLQCGLGVGCGHDNQDGKCGKKSFLHNSRFFDAKDRQKNRLFTYFFVDFEMAKAFLS